MIESEKVENALMNIQSSKKNSKLNVLLNEGGEDHDIWSGSKKKGRCSTSKSTAKKNDIVNKNYNS